MSDSELPAFISELEALEAKATPGPWDIGISYISNKADIYVDSSEGIRIDESANSIADSRFIAALRNHAPALLALVRQLQGENAKLTIQASKYAYECELAKRERDRAEARFHSLMIEGKITNG